MKSVIPQFSYPTNEDVKKLLFSHEICEKLKYYVYAYYDPADMSFPFYIGKGKRNQAVIDAIVRNGSVYFAAVGGAGALLSKCITSSEVVAYDDLGTEAIRKLTVENFPVIVVIDKVGINLYESAIKVYCRMEENA